ncbi:MAG: flagellar basal body P-ring formation protein FlgA [Candidatus Hydrogenedentes bacterium]|nr:flagellar basal body P-ring formation protein FlgA [Candidatus Hydrogenedentota bacterium]
MFSKLLATVPLMLATWAVWPDTVTIKDEALVKGPKIRLGEIAELRGEHAATLAELDVGPAATPGNAKIVDAALLLSRIQNTGVDVSNMEVQGAKSVRATTLSLELTPEVIAEDLREFIATQMPWDAADATVDVYPPAKSEILPDGQVAIRWMPNPEYGWVGPEVFRGELVVDGAVKKALLCKATIQAYGEVVVAAQDIPRGAVISQADLTTERRTLGVSKEAGFTRPADLIGAVAKTSIFTGQLISRRQVEAPKLVKRNQIVSVEVSYGALVVRARARALADGREGDLVPCATLESKEMFQGVVRKDGTVVVD